MYNVTHITDIFLVVMYFGLFAVYMKPFFDLERQPWRFLPALFPLVLLVHLLKLVVQGVCDGHCPIVTFGETFSFTAFCLGMIYLIARRRRIYCAEGAVFVGLICLFQLIAVIAATNNVMIYDRLRNIPFGFHAPIALIGMALFAASALYGILYIIMFRLLRSKSPVFSLDQLPPLERVESMLDLSMILGTVFFGLAMIAGSIMGKIYDLHIFTDPKVLVSIFVFAIFAYGSVGSKFFAFSGYRKSIISILGFSAVIISMTIVRVYLTKLHGF